MGKRGPKPGTGGRPKKALYDNILDGNPSKRPLKVLDDNIKQNGIDFIPPDFLNEKGVEIFNNTVEWLRGTKCLGYINPQHIEEYAHCKSRWLECEEWNEKNLLAKHPTTGQPMQSPYVDIGLKYLRQADSAWNKIWEIVRENSQVDFRSGNPHEDAMEELLTLGKKSINRS